MDAVYVVTITMYENGKKAHNGILGVYKEEKEAKENVVSFADQWSKEDESGPAYNVQHFPYGFSEVFSGEGEGMKNMKALVKSQQHTVS